MKIKKLFLCIGTTAVSLCICVSICVSAEYPEHYKTEEGNVQADCEVAAPDTIQRQCCMKMQVDGCCYADPDSAFDYFSEDCELEERSEFNASSNYPATCIYDFTNHSQLYAGGCLSYVSENAGWYIESGIISDKLYRDVKELSFSESGKCIEEVKQILDNMKIPSEQFRFQWYSMDKEQLAKQEKQHVEDGLMEKDRIKQEWKKEDEVYLIYGYQYMQDIPVFHESMGIYQAFALDTVESAPVIAVCSSRGIEMMMIGNVYNLSQTEEQYSLLEIDEIMKVPLEKYNSFLGDTQYKITQMKFFLRVGRNTAQKLEAEPVWRFTVKEDTGKTQVTLVNAETGKEIYLQ